MSFWACRHNVTATLILFPLKRSNCSTGGNTCRITKKWVLLTLTSASCIILITTAARVFLWLSETIAVATQLQILLACSNTARTCGAPFCLVLGFSHFCCNYWFWIDSTTLKEISDRGILLKSSCSTILSCLAISSGEMSKKEKSARTF